MGWDLLVDPELGVKHLSLVFLGVDLLQHEGTLEIQVSPGDPLGRRDSRALVVILHRHSVQDYRPGCCCYYFPGSPQVTLPDYCCYHQIMRKPSRSQTPEGRALSRFKCGQPNMGPGDRTGTKIGNQNADIAGRLQSIRRKYSSKEKNIFTMRGDPDNEKPTLPPRQPSAGEREPLQQRFSLQNQTRSNATLIEYKSAYGSQMQGNFRVADSRQDLSKEKVCERVQNIRKINDKIKSILNKFEVETLEDNSSFQKRLPQQTHCATKTYRSQKTPRADSKPYKCFQSQMSYQDLEPVPRLSSAMGTFQSTAVIQPQKNNWGATIDQSFVIQKYNPSVDNEFRDLISCICAQIQYDQQCRASKYFFLLNMAEDKYQRLRKEFANRGVAISPEQLKTSLKFTEEEYDPFMKQQPHDDYNKCAKSILAANAHWENRLHKKFEYNKLMDQGIQDYLVPDNQQLLSVSDMVRFVNLTSGSLYKNRDVVLIMRRMGGTQLSRQQVLGSFCTDCQR